jgi:hypothetical protein
MNLDWEHDEWLINLLRTIFTDEELSSINFNEMREFMADIHQLMEKRIIETIRKLLSIDDAVQDVYSIAKQLLLPAEDMKKVYENNFNTMVETEGVKEITKDVKG